jgi:hypothetical protein
MSRSCLVSSCRCRRHRPAWPAGPTAGWPPGFRVPVQDTQPAASDAARRKEHPRDGRAPGPSARFTPHRILLTTRTRQCRRRASPKTGGLAWGQTWMSRWQTAVEYADMRFTSGGFRLVRQLAPDRPARRGAARKPPTVLREDHSYSGRMLIFAPRNTDSARESMFPGQKP